jgi:hypothetical protein
VPPDEPEDEDPPELELPPLEGLAVDEEPEVPAGLELLEALPPPDDEELVPSLFFEL